MDTVETSVLRLLDGKGLDGEIFCDFTVADQNEAIGNGIIDSTVCFSFLKAIGKITFQVGKTVERIVENIFYACGNAIHFIVQKSILNI